MPAFNEQENISRIVDDFRAMNIVDEIIVVDNNSSDATARLAQGAGARVILEKRQGYGYACQAGLRAASGDYVVLLEPDGTFLAKDIFKFLAYAEDFSLVQGTRTTREMIWRGANMGILLKWGNWSVAKILEVLYGGPSLTDMGCTYRLIRREALEKIKDELSVGGSAFLAEMTTRALKKRIHTIEISVNYLSRKGASKITGSFRGAVDVCLRMLLIIFSGLFRR
jgi:glycosyltransferase involved in cell wall biosynthesis